MHQLVQEIKSAIDTHNLLKIGDHVIVTLSGGADSVALLSALVSLGYRCTAAHCNFHLRGEESNRDCRHALSVASDLGVECIVKDFDVATYEREHKVSTEMACRELRYEWFEQLRTGLNAQTIAVAHHRDDNIETFFLNLMRGTGIAGLCGMSFRNGNIIRPMLNCTRSDIEQYLKSQQLDFVTDSTNLLNDFRRNRLRNVIIPAIAEQFPGAENAISSTIRTLQKNASIYLKYIQIAEAKYRDGNSINITDLIASESEPQTILFEIIRKWGFNSTHAGDIISSSHNTGRVFYSESHSALLNRGILLISDLCEQSDSEAYQIDLTKNVDIPLRLNVSISKYSGKPLHSDRQTIVLDAKVFDGNPRFALRRWRKGDRLQPYGMCGSKKVSDIFSDAKLSRLQKAQMWILTRNDEILWVVGLRASRFFQVNQTTTHIITISC